MGNYLGIDIDSTNTKMIIGENKRSIPTPNSRQELIGEIFKFIRETDLQFVSGIGIAFPGMSKNGTSIDLSSIGSDLIGLSQNYFMYLYSPVYFINRTDAAALAGILEYPNSKVLVSIVNGNTISSGIVINGHTFSGANGLNGEINNSFFTPKKDAFHFCSAYKLKEILNKMPAKMHTTIIRSFARNFGMLMANVINMLNPDVIYLTGEAFEYDNFLENALDFVNNKVHKQLLENLTITTSKFGCYSSAVGAIEFLKQSIR